MTVIFMAFVGMLASAGFIGVLGWYVNHELELDYARTVTFRLAMTTLVAFLISFFLPLGFLPYIPAFLTVGFSVANLVRTQAEMDYRAETDLLRSRRPEFKHCPQCRTELVERVFDGKTKKACPRCTFVHWNNPLIVAVALVPSPDGKKLLMIKRGNPPREGYWALPGGFVETAESIVEGCVREIKEETGFDIRVERVFWEAPVRQKNEVLVFFVATITGGEARTSTETTEVTFFAPEEIPEEVAFPTHQHAITMFLPALRQAGEQVPNAETPAQITLPTPANDELGHDAGDHGC